MPTAYIGIGANLGDAHGAVLEAVAALARLPGCRLRAMSSVWRSAPVDAQGPDFFNAVAALETTLSPEDLLAALQALERRAGRQRPYRHAPRTLDLDLLLYGDRVLHDDTLTLPHPRLHLRAFVLQPLAEIDPRLVLPGHGGLAPWLARAADQGIERIGAA